MQKYHPTNDAQMLKGHSSWYILCQTIFYNNYTLIKRRWNVRLDRRLYYTHIIRRTDGTNNVYVMLTHFIRVNCVFAIYNSREFNIYASVDCTFVPGNLKTYKISFIVIPYSYISENIYFTLLKHIYE